MSRPLGNPVASAVIGTDCRRAGKDRTDKAGTSRRGGFRIVYDRFFGQFFLPKP